MKKHTSALALFFAILLTLLFLSGCGKIDLKSDYQVVFLTNGQAFIGKLEGAGSEYPLLKDVYYIQSGVEQGTKQVTNVLVKRGRELHGPDFMYINARNILMIEPVSAESQVGKLIKEAKAQEAKAQSK
ncbi:MAG TPA: hypothetical protein PK793_10890 [Syntrophales bacterium]|nr:hypothetical protein [Syntrophales bacterium]